MWMFALAIGISSYIVYKFKAPEETFFRLYSQVSPSKYNTHISQNLSLSFVQLLFIKTIYQKRIKRA